MVVILRGRFLATVTGKGYSPSIIKLGPWRWVTFSFCVLFFSSPSLCPSASLLVGRSSASSASTSWDMLTLEHYRPYRCRTRRCGARSRNTMLLGADRRDGDDGASAARRLCLGAHAAGAAAGFIEALAWLPWMMPGMVLGVGFLWAFAMLPGPIPIYGTVWALLLAYMALGTPLAVRVMSGTYHQLSFDLEECSRVHGASWCQAAVAHPYRAGVAVLRGRVGTAPSSALCANCRPRSCSTPSVQKFCRWCCSGCDPTARPNRSA